MNETPQFQCADRPDWHSYLMSLACLVASRSPDPSTKHGCVIVDNHYRILGLGYNGFPRGGNLSYPVTRPEKYEYVVHSELNALLNCTSRPEGATVYVTGMPCNRCMVAMVQAGIVRVIYGSTGSVMVPPEIQERTEFVARNHDVLLVPFASYCSPSPLKVLEDTIEYLRSKNWNEKD